MSKKDIGNYHERKIIHYALEQGALFCIKGAASKIYSENKNLKIDLAIFKPPYVYLIQSKSRPNGKAEKEVFYKETAGLEKYWFVRAKYIESTEDMKKIFEPGASGMDVTKRLHEALTEKTL